MSSGMAALADVDLSVADAGLVDLPVMVGGNLEVSRDGECCHQERAEFMAQFELPPATWAL